MLGYRHAFHAGNHGDILKHLVLYHCLRYMTRKPKSLQYVDTHAGSGSYRLDEGFAAKNREWETGFGRLSGENAEGSMPDSVREYLDFVLDYRRGHPGEFPGSPAIAASILRPKDRLILDELHPSDLEELRARFSADPRAQVRGSDGFAVLRAVLPPPYRRGLVLMDPPYELASEYDRVPDSLEDALRRFETGTFLVWYPLLERPEARSLKARLSALTDRPKLIAELRVRRTLPGDRGLGGSGMFVVNPPWTLEAALRSALPFLAETLGQDASSSGGVEIEA